MLRGTSRRDAFVLAGGAAAIGIAKFDGAESREVVGKKVAHLRRNGRLPAVIFGRGLESVAVRSNIVRTESHPFYERVGYQRVKTQHAYFKRL